MMTDPSSLTIDEVLSVIEAEAAVIEAEAAAIEAEENATDPGFADSMGAVDEEPGKDGPHV